MPIALQLLMQARKLVKEQACLNSHPTHGLQEFFLPLWCWMNSYHFVAFSPKGDRNHGSRWPLSYHQIHLRPNASKRPFVHLSQDACHIFTKHMPLQSALPWQTFKKINCGMILAPSDLILVPCITDRNLLSPTLTGMLRQFQMGRARHITGSSPAQSRPLT